MARFDCARRVAAVAGVIWLMAAIPMVTAAADPVAGAPDQAVALDKGLSGHLDGGGGSQFAYYKFAYPGGMVVSINMIVRPDDPVVLENVGFRVYGPKEGQVYLRSGVQPGLAPNISGDLVSADPGVYLVQVYNANASAPVDFTIWATGVPASLAPSGPVASAPLPGVVGTTAVLAPPGAPVPPASLAQPATTQAAAPDEAVPLTGPASGQLAGGSGGHFAYYKLHYPGGVVATINVRVVPDDPVVLRDVGFNVYGPTPNKVYVRSSAQPGLIPNLSGDLVSSEPGDYLIQIYSYHPSASIAYDVWATGVPTDAVARR